MEWNNATIPTDAFPEVANLNLADDNNDRITVAQQLSIQQPTPEEYIPISKWDLSRIRKRCEGLKTQPILLSDIILTIGSLTLGAFLSTLFSGVDITKSRWLVPFVLLPVIGSCALIAAFFMKKGEHDDAKKAADDIEEILIHISQEDKEE